MYQIWSNLYQIYLEQLLSSNFVKSKFPSDRYTMFSKDLFQRKITPTKIFTRTTTFALAFILKKNYPLRLHGVIEVTNSNRLLHTVQYGLTLELNTLKRVTFLQNFLLDVLQYWRHWLNCQKTLQYGLISAQITHSIKSHHSCKICISFYIKELSILTYWRHRSRKFHTKSFWSKNLTKSNDTYFIDNDVIEIPNFICLHTQNYLYGLISVLKLKAVIQELHVLTS